MDQCNMLNLSADEVKYEELQYIHGVRVKIVVEP